MSIDPRFSDAYLTVDELLGALDLDEVDDLETLLMMLFDHPVSVVDVEDGEREYLEIWSEHLEQTQVEFPIRLTDLVRWCATLEVRDSSGGARPLGEGRPVCSTSTDAELTGSLRDVLGKVRLFNLMYED
jgi:hypothetical protein